MPLRLEDASPVACQSPMSPRLWLIFIFASFVYSRTWSVPHAFKTIQVVPTMTERPHALKYKVLVDTAKQEVTPFDKTTRPDAIAALTMTIDMMQKRKNHNRSPGLGCWAPS
jgi:hypothetical protein